MTLKTMYGMLVVALIAGAIFITKSLIPEKVDGTAIITTNNGAIIYDGEIDKKLTRDNNEIEIYTKDGMKYTADINNVIIIEKVK